ncbi:LuxR family maltose regulon positive regulatory protein [Aequitasia blattaphilus]|uniref:LuxR C-terminal-related transcriptional regulator n=1 Tax=Aequitasia blattaphilus TaxID=2949332 RepID=A0ABT1EAZ6_9FIRM|nr:LuxR C-terminal-related transcriptional regulator [Aequitasia blattaphilus]MCP1101677.1 LuxR C-terminal-related transcriptional regulator [Aequitasia blattaphilus]MCR8614317.1 LuxR C-terminal-related transcriptional regulator [Aequitasia blattaphilus]
MAEHILIKEKVEALLTTGLQSPLITVVAPPGYGKTTVVREYISRLSTPCIWINITELENDIDFFWNTFSRALIGSFPGVASVLKNISMPVNIEDFTQFYHLLRSCSKEQIEITVIYDNYEILTNRDILQFINRCIKLDTFEKAFIPHHILLSCERLSSYKNPFYDDYKNPGSYTRITANDLAFDYEDAKKYMEINNYVLDGRFLDEVLKKTDGWPIFLDMLCETMDENKTYMILFELFENHYYGNYSQEIQIALIKCSLFSSFSLGLMKQILPNPSEETLSEISLNILVDFNFNTEVFTFHKVYHTFLKGKLIVLSEEDRRNILNAAAEWYFKCKKYEEAMEMFMKVENHEGFLKTLPLVSLDRSSYTLSKDLQSFYGSTPQELLEDNLWIDFYLAQTYVTCGQIDYAKGMFLALLKTVEKKKNPCKKLVVEIYCMLADISLIKNNTMAMEYINCALNEWEENILIGNRTLANFDENPVFYLPSDGSKNVEEMIDYIHTFVKLRDKIRVNCNYGFEHLFEAEAYYYTKEFNKCKVAARLAISKSVLTKQFDITMQAHYILALIALCEKNYEGVVQETNLLNTYVSGDQNLSLSKLKELLNAGIYFQVDDENKVADWIKEGEFESYKEYPIRNGRNYFFSALYNMHISNYTKSASMLFHLEPLFGQRGLFILKIYYHVISAIYFMQEQEKEKAVEHFLKTYNYVYENKIVMPIVEFGNQIVPTLYYVKQRTDLDIDLEWVKELEVQAKRHEDSRQYIRSAYKSAKRKIGSNTFALTKRERVVLNLLSQGFTRNEIAEQLGISLNGVKKFINNIYIKLGAKNRADAIYIAVQNHII